MAECLSCNEHEQDKLGDGLCIICMERIWHGEADGETVARNLLGRITELDLEVQRLTTAHATKQGMLNQARKRIAEVEADYETTIRENEALVKEREFTDTRIAELEVEVGGIKSMLEELVDYSECRYDRDGICQTHGHNLVCVHSRARVLLAR